MSTSSSIPADRELVALSAGADAAVADVGALDIVEQLVEQLAERVHSLSRIGPTSDWPLRTDSARAAAVRVARRLGAGEPSRRAAAMQVVHALWADGAPPPGWWRTPLGRVLEACGAGDPGAGPYRSTA